MTKIRVHELAKEFGIGSKEMEARIKDLGIVIKNYMSTLEDYEVQAIRQSFLSDQEKDGKAVSVTGESPRVVVRRKHQVIRFKKIVSPTVEEPQTQVASPSDMPEKGAEAGLPPSVESAPEGSEPSAAEESPVQVQGGITGLPEEVHAAPETGQAGVTPIEKGGEEEAVSPEAVSPEPPVPEPEATVSPEPGESAEPKRYVRIVERPRIYIPPPAPPRGPRPAPSGPRPSVGERRRPPASAGAGPRPPQAEPSPASPPPGGPERAKRKGKRVVKVSDMDERGKRRRTEVKGEKLQPLTKILAEEIGVVAQPEAEEGLEFYAPTGERRRRKAPPPGTLPPKAGKRKISIYETIQVGELAKRMGVKVGEVIMRLMGMGAMVTANQSIDFDTAALLASEYDFEVEHKSVAEDLVNIEMEAGEGIAVLRPPVVTVMGHVDHGKTSLLDAIRDADVVSREAGGITQHIGAYHVTLPTGKEVVFLDTPGHEAFTAMRARGAKVTDIVLLVVAADDGVMAQTREAVDHARAAGVPIIVAINKIDKPGANPDKVKRELADIGLVPEEWGGDTITVSISAKQRIGIDELLEMLALQAEVMELTAVPDRPAKGHVIEARLDKGRGPIATFLVSEGTLRTGDAFVCGLHHGKVRAMINDKGEQVESAGPSIPVEIHGLSGVPEAGNEFVVLPDEKKAREVAEYRQLKAREAELVKTGKVSLENVFERMKEQEVKELSVLLKTDVQGSSEALADALSRLSTQEIRVNIVRSGTGGIVESDVLLASASNAIIIGFNVRPTSQAKALAEQEGVEIRFYDVIYDAIEDVKKAMVGLLEPVFEEQILGHASVRETFQVPKVGTIAGCYVTDGVVQRNAKVRILRDGVVVHSGKIGSLRRFKEDVKEAQAGYECGIGIDHFNDVKIGDVIEVYKLEEKQPELGAPLGTAS